MSKVKGEFLKELQGIGKKDKEENTEENTDGDLALYVFLSGRCFDLFFSSLLLLLLLAG